MLNPILVKILLTTLTYGAGGAAISLIVFFFNRNKEGPRLDQLVAVGFLVGAAFGAFVGIFQSMLMRY